MLKQAGKWLVRQAIRQIKTTSEKQSKRSAGKRAGNYRTLVIPMPVETIGRLMAVPGTTVAEKIATLLINYERRTKGSDR